jgi:CubicO group peptidase (beta-lactamase class C family)
MNEWAKKPLDFDPGTRWQYSNTNYVIAGVIVERVAGMPFMPFLRTRIFTPLGMTSVTNVDSAPLGPGDAGRYLRNALGPLREAPKEGRGWLFAAGGLGMTAHDLALWDIALIEGKVLRPESHAAMQTVTRLANGVGTTYGLGVNATLVGGRRRISHGGAVSGFLTTNEVYPGDRAAIVVFANTYPGAADPNGTLAGRIRGIIFERSDSVAAAALVRMRAVYDGLHRGTIDRSQLSPNASAYFTDAVLADYAASLGPLGAPKSFEPAGEFTRGGMTGRRYMVRAGERTLSVSTFVWPDGKIEQYLVERAE